MKMSPTFDSAPALLIDASIHIFRYYFALPDHWISQSGLSTAAVYGYTTFLLELLHQERPEVIAAAFDESLDSCFRNSIYPAYKSSRSLPDNALAFQLAACREVTELLGIPAFSSCVYEADDLLGTLMALLGDQSRPIALLSRDKDLGQLLIREQDFLWDKATNQRFYRDDIWRKFGVFPEQMVDYLALVGDSADDIPGVTGIGAKTAQALLAFGGNILGVYGRIDEVADLPIRGARHLPDKLINATKQIAMSRSLATIICDAPLNVTPTELVLQSRPLAPLTDFCIRMGFPRLLNSIGALHHIHAQ